LDKNIIASIRKDSNPILTYHVPLSADEFAIGNYGPKTHELVYKYRPVEEA
jgi:hypothetical protein